MLLIYISPLTELRIIYRNCYLPIFCSYGTFSRCCVFKNAL